MWMDGDWHNRSSHRRKERRDTPQHYRPFSSFSFVESAISLFTFHRNKGGNLAGTHQNFATGIAAHLLCAIHFPPLSSYSGKSVWRKKERRKFRKNHHRLENSRAQTTETKSVDDWKFHIVSVLCAINWHRFHSLPLSRPSAHYYTFIVTFSPR